MAVRLSRGLFEIWPAGRYVRSMGFVRAGDARRSVIERVGWEAAIVRRGGVAHGPPNICQSRRIE
jgi:hypothetical protein